MEFRVAGFVQESVIDGPGINFVLFLQGCHKRCEDCHNPEAQPLDGGFLMSLEEIIDLIPPGMDNVVFSGGEPFIQAKALSVLGERLDVPVIVYTGYQFEELKNNEDALSLLKLTKYLIDGEYRKDTPQVAFRGSANQRIIDVQASLREGETKEVNW